MKVLKFGGTSVGSVDALLKVKSIVSLAGQCVVVVSAMSGVTNRLIALFDVAVKNGKQFDKEIALLKNQHITTAQQLLEGESLHSYYNELDDTIARMTRILTEVAEFRGSLVMHKDELLSMGEEMSSHLVSKMLNAAWCDGKDLIVTDDNFGCAKILWTETCRNVNQAFLEPAHVTVVPGFCGRSKNGDTTTLGRGGSDLSAAMLAAALKSEILEIWTDVNGMMTADPRVEHKAITIPALTYSEAAELCHFGAKVLYTPAIWPAVRQQIPVYIKNTFAPNNGETLINAKGDPFTASPVRGISHIPNVSLITICGNGMLGQVGMSYRILGILAKENINILFISQASSEYSISFAVQGSDGARTVRLLEACLAEDAANGIINEVNIDKDMALLAVVGSNMQKMPGTAGKMFSTLGKYGINVAAIAQGGSELNISVVVNMKQVERAVQVLHSAFFLGGHIVMDLYMTGLGNVGLALLEQLRKQCSYIKEFYGIEMNLKGLMNSRKMLISNENILNTWPTSWENCKTPASITDFIAHITSARNHNTLFVDCTANASIADVYQTLLESGVSVITANKIAASSSFMKYSALLAAAKNNSCSFRYETNVGAGLPVLATIEDMVKSGDRVTAIEAVLSGSLNFILNKVRNGDTLLSAITKAREAGFTEPDPRIDLSGKDVKRKLLILSRVAGYALEDSDIIENPFLPAELLAIDDMDKFYEEIAIFGKEFEARVAKLAAEGKCLRYIARMRDGKAEIGLSEVPSEHPFYLLDDSNNIVMIYSERYKAHPMTIRGYGAGAEVTAAGVFADIMKCVLN